MFRVIFTSVVPRTIYTWFEAMSGGTSIPLYLWAMINKQTNWEAFILLAFVGMFSALISVSIRLAARERSVADTRRSRVAKTLRMCADCITKGAHPIRAMQISNADELEHGEDVCFIRNELMRCGHPDAFGSLADRVTAADMLRLLGEARLRGLRLDYDDGLPDLMRKIEGLHV